MSSSLLSPSLRYIGQSDTYRYSLPPKQNLAGDFPNNFSSINVFISVIFSQKFVLITPMDNKSVLAQVMAVRQRGNKPLHELMLAHFTDAYLRN